MLAETQMLRAERQWLLAKMTSKNNKQKNNNKTREECREGANLSPRLVQCFSKYIYLLAFLCLYHNATSFLSFTQSGNTYRETVQLT